MKQNIAVKICLLAMILIPSYTKLVLADSDLSGWEMQNITEFSYHAGPGDSREIAFALASFGAKHKAVLLSWAPGWQRIAE